MDCLGAMDVCVSTQSNDVVGNVRTTGKLPLYLAAEKCVVATDVGEARRVLPGLGYVLPYSGVKDTDHPKRLAELVGRLVDKSADVNIGRTRRREVAAREFGYDRLAERVVSLCARLTQNTVRNDD